MRTDDGVCRIWKSGLNISAALGLALVLAACGSDASEETDGADFEIDLGDQGNYSIDSESGETVARITNEDGTAILRSGENVPVDLPFGFSLFPGAKVMTSTAFTQGEATGNMVLFETDASPEDVAEFYRRQAEDADIAIELELKINHGEVLAGEGADGRSFSLNANPKEDGEDGKTTAQLMVGQALGR